MNEQWHAARINSIRIAVEQICFSGENAQTRFCAVDRTRRWHGLTGEERRIESAAAIRVLDPVKRCVSRERDSRRKMNPADITHSARRKRRLAVAEKTGCARERDGDFGGIGLDA